MTDDTDGDDADRYDATLDVRGDFAQRAARDVLDALGVGAGQVETISVELHTDDDDRGETVTTFDADGPAAGRIARAMIGGVDFEAHPANRVRVVLNTRSAAETPGVHADDPPEQTTPETVADGNGETTTETGGDTAASGAKPEARGPGDSYEKGEAEYDQPLGKETPNVSEPQPITPETRPHEALTLLAREIEESDDEWVPVNRLWTRDDHNFPSREAVGTAIGQAFLEHARCDRLKVPQDHGGMKNVYTTTDATRETFDRIGRAETDGGADE